MYQHLHGFTISKVVLHLRYISFVIIISPHMNNTSMLPRIFPKYHGPSYFAWKWYIFINFDLFLILKALDVSHHIFIVIWSTLEHGVNYGTNIKKYNQAWCKPTFGHEWSCLMVSLWHIINCNDGIHAWFKLHWNR